MTTTPSPDAQQADAWSDGLPPCTTCGICCFFDDPRYVMVFESDDERLADPAGDLSHFIDGRRYMRRVDGHCIALRQVGNHWQCSIYERRPDLCREFERGNGKCRELVPLRHPRFRKSGTFPDETDGVT